MSFVCDLLSVQISILGHQPPPPGSPEDTTPEGMLASYMQTLNQEDLRDLVVCEAIKRAVGELDGEVRRFSNAGMSHVRPTTNQIIFHCPTYKSSHCSHTNRNIVPLQALPWRRCFCCGTPTIEAARRI